MTKISHSTLPPTHTYTPTLPTSTFAPRPPTQTFTPDPLDCDLPAGTSCTIALDVPPEPSVTPTPDCADARVSIEFVHFDSLGDVRLRVTNNRTIESEFTGFTLVWPHHRPIKFVKMVVGGSSANDVNDPFNNPNGTSIIVWQNDSGGAETSTTNSGNGSQGQWLTNFIFPPNSVTDIHLDFTGVGSATLQSIGAHASEFNGSSFRIACGRAASGAGGGGGGQSGDITFSEVPPPGPTSPVSPTNTLVPTIGSSVTPSQTRTAGPPTQTFTPRPPTQTFTPSAMLQASATFTLRAPTLVFTPSPTTQAASNFSPTPNGQFELSRSSEEVAFTQTIEVWLTLNSDNVVQISASIDGDNIPVDTLVSYNIPVQAAIIPDPSTELKPTATPFSTGNTYVYDRMAARLKSTIPGAFEISSQSDEIQDSNSSYLWKWTIVPSSNTPVGDKKLIVEVFIPVESEPVISRHEIVIQVNDGRNQIQIIIETLVAFVVGIGGFLGALIAIKETFEKLFGDREVRLHAQKGQSVNLQLSDLISTSALIHQREQSEMSPQLFQRVVDVIIPHVSDSASRKALINSTFFGQPIVDEINTEGTAATFTVHLVTVLYRVDGHAAIITLLETLKNRLGASRRQEIDAVIADL